MSRAVDADARQSIVHTRSAGRSGGRAAAVDLGLARGLDLAVDVAVVTFAAWTPIYQLFLVTGTRARWSLPPDLLVLIAAAVAVPRLQRNGGTDHLPVSRVRPSLPVALTAAVGVAAAVLFAIDSAPWHLSWAAWAVTVAAATVLALRGSWRTRHATDADSAGAGADRPGSLVAAGCALALAAVSLFIVRLDADDIHYVNLTTWVAQHGIFPTGDTLLSDQVYPALYWPPIDSYPEIAGLFARAVHMAGSDVIYLIVPPIGTALAVLALWRLLRAWRVAHVEVALVLALLFLLWSATAPYALGNYFVARMWQGKVLMLCIAVPLLFAYLHRYVARPTARNAIMPLAVSIAAVGASTSAMFLLPVVAAAGLAPLALRSPLRAAGGFLAAAGYPLGAALVTLAVNGHTPDVYTDSQVVPSVLAHYVLDHGAIAGLGLGAIVLGWLAVREPATRLTIAVVALLVALIYAPGVSHVLFHTTGLGRTLWRMVWAAPVAALFGALGARLLRPLREHRRNILRYAVPVVLAVAVILAGRPVWSPTNGASFTATPRAKWPSASLSDARAVLAHSRPGDKVVVPMLTSWALASTDSTVKTVDPRGLFTYPLRGEPGFHLPARVELKSLADGDLPADQRDHVGADITAVGVAMACVKSTNAGGAAVLARLGYPVSFRTPDMVCYDTSGR